jgi:hypothetical protein
LRIHKKRRCRRVGFRWESSYSLLNLLGIFP